MAAEREVVAMERAVEEKVVRTEAKVAAARVVVGSVCEVYVGGEDDAGGVGGGCAAGGCAAVVLRVAAAGGREKRIPKKAPVQDGQSSLTS